MVPAPFCITLDGYFIFPGLQKISPLPPTVVPRWALEGCCCSAEVRESSRGPHAGGQLPDVLTIRSIGTYGGRGGGGIPYRLTRESQSVQNLGGWQE